MLIAKYMGTNNLTYEEKKKLYSQHFSLGNLTTDITNKFALVALICFITNEKNKQSPGTTCYSIIESLTRESKLPEDYKETLAIICEDYMFMCTTFPTFGIKSAKEMVAKIKSILNDWLPF